MSRAALIGLPILLVLDICLPSELGLFSEQAVVKIMSELGGFERKYEKMTALVKITEVYLVIHIRSPENVLELKLNLGY